jgi:hypothetical protein
VKIINKVPEEFVATATLMADNTMAWLSASRNYYVRREKHSPKGNVITIQTHPWTHIAYYDLVTRKRIPLARAMCTSCLDSIESKHCGDYVHCSCGASAVDTDRWVPERHRYIGHALSERMS